MAKGYVALVLHAHLPFVRHPENPEALEERWLFEALTECYLPLISVMNQWTIEGISWRITLSVSPTLVAMLSDSLLKERYRVHLNQLIQLSESEVRRTEVNPEEYAVAAFYLDRHRQIRDLWNAYDGDVIRALRAFYDVGNLEVITTCATHAFLPLVLTDEAVRAQIQAAVQVHTSAFQRPPSGIWLPECAYRRGVEDILAEYGIQYFFLDCHGVQNAAPNPIFGLYSPILTRSGVAAFGRDPESADLVWSSAHGYPGDYDYREFYRDIGYDLPMDYIGPWLPEGKLRIDTGLKYHRITGEGSYKALYNPDWAREKAASHAGHFMNQLTAQIERLSSEMGRKPIITSMYDAELFGHWWFEGPLFIDCLFRKIHFDQDTIGLITPLAYLDLYQDYQVCQLETSSWGRDGYAEVWLNGTNDWVYPAVHQAERDMIQLANRFADAQGLTARVLRQAVRELLLAQSSDWAFIMDNKTTVDYAIRRLKAHVNRFSTLRDMLLTGQFDVAILQEIEERDCLFDDVDPSVYCTNDRYNHRATDRNAPTVLMLTWEYPPHIVGGLARHVSQLAESLVDLGWEVHVVTSETWGAPYDERANGVYVHRCHVLQPQAASFLDAVFQLNLAMVRRVQSLVQEGLRFDVLHSHDWLVYNASKTIKERYQCPLISTIHATEHGRNNGIHTALQSAIHQQDNALMYESKDVIVCSQFMKNEVREVFALPDGKIHVIPNGIAEQSTSRVQAATRLDSTSDVAVRKVERHVLFIGRLVREKGIHVLIQALPQILASHPDTVIDIVGKGPMLDTLRSMAEGLPVRFPGFVTDDVRDELLGNAAVCVFPSLYEPFGIVALEAMAAGVPVVVSATGGLGEIVQHEQNGLTSIPGNADSLANQVNRVLSDATLGARLSQRALEDVHQHYLWPAIAERTAQIYEGTMCEGAPSGTLSSHERRENAG